MHSLKEKLKTSPIMPYLRRLKSFFPSRKKYSYSQNGEDLLIDFFFSGKKHGVYVDIGAYHPTSLSNTYRLYRRGWTGINIEPNRRKWVLFERSRSRDTNLNIGIGVEKSSVPFFVFDADTLSTFSAEAATRQEALGHRIVARDTVDLLPLASVLSTYAAKGDIDLLSVDTEGFDLEVLKTNDWQRFRPKLVILETVEYSHSVFGPKLNATYDAYMEGIGYQKVADTYINTIYADTSFVKAHEA